MGVLALLPSKLFAPASSDGGQFEDTLKSLSLLHNPVAVIGPLKCFP